MEEIIPVKIIVLGQANAGKSCLLNRYLTGIYKEGGEATIGAVFVSKLVKHRDKTLRLNVWDTAGQERYRSFAKIYFREAKALIMVYDLSNPDSITGMNEWYESCAEVIPIDCKVFVAGTKMDLGSFTEEIKEKIDLFRIKTKSQHYLVSAKTGEGIEILFENIAMNMFRKKSEATNSIRLSLTKTQKKKCC